MLRHKYFQNLCSGVVKISDFGTSTGLKEEVEQGMSLALREMIRCHAECGGWQGGSRDLESISTNQQKEK